MVYAQPSICPGEWDAQTPTRFRRTNGSPNLAQTTRPDNNQQKSELQHCGFYCHRVKLKEREKKDKYQDLAKELKKTVEHESDIYTNCNWCSWCSHHMIKRAKD